MGIEGVVMMVVRLHSGVGTAVSAAFQPVFAFDWVNQPVNDALLFLGISAVVGAVICLIKAIPHATGLDGNTGQAVKGIVTNGFGALLCIAIAGGSVISLLQTAHAPAGVQKPSIEAPGNAAPTP